MKWSIPQGDTQEIQESQNAYAQGGRSSGVIPLGRCKTEVPKVEGAALPGAELVDLAKIQRSAAFEVEQAQRDFYFGKW